MSQEFTLTIEKGVPLPDGQIRGGVHAKHKKNLLSMAIGDSFFLENITKEEISNLIRYAKRLGVHLLARDTDEDEDYMAPGVRAWRVEQEDLPGRKPNATSKSIFDPEFEPDSASSALLANVAQPSREDILHTYNIGASSIKHRDELLRLYGYDAPDIRYWRNKKESLVMRTDAGEKPKGFTEICENDYRSLLATGDAFEARSSVKKEPQKTPQEEPLTYEHPTYYYHAESESVWKLAAGEPIGTDADSVGSVLISQEAYQAFVFVEGVLEQREQPGRLYLNNALCYAAIQPEARHEEMIAHGWRQVPTVEFCGALLDWYNAPSYWRSPSTGHILQKAVGWTENKTLHFDDWEEVTEAEYSAESLLKKPDYETYWRRANGTCTIVPPEKFEKALKTDGAVQISQRVYERWLAEQPTEDEL